MRRMCTRIRVALEVLDDSPTRIGIVVMEVDDSPKNEAAGDKKKEENKKES
jgi:hypothetical protein